MGINATTSIKERAGLQSRDKNNTTSEDPTFTRQHKRPQRSTCLSLLILLYMKYDHKNVKKKDENDSNCKANSSSKPCTLYQREVRSISHVVSGPCEPHFCRWPLCRWLHQLHRCSNPLGEGVEEGPIPSAFAELLWLLASLVRARGDVLAIPFLPPPSRFWILMSNLSVDSVSGHTCWAHFWMNSCIEGFSVPDELFLPSYQTKENTNALSESLISSASLVGMVQWKFCSQTLLFLLKLHTWLKKNFFFILGHNISVSRDWVHNLTPPLNAVHIAHAFCTSLFSFLKLKV